MDQHLADPDTICDCFLGPASDMTLKAHIPIPTILKGYWEEPPSKGVVSVLLKMRVGLGQGMRCNAVKKKAYQDYSVDQFNPL